MAATLWLGSVVAASMVGRRSDVDVTRGQFGSFLQRRYVGELLSHTVGKRSATRCGALDSTLAAKIRRSRPCHGAAGRQWRDHARESSWRGVRADLATLSRRL